MAPNERVKSPRGPNYDPIENEALCRAWVRISTDSATGVNQTAARFWSRVKDDYDGDEAIVAEVSVGRFEPRTATSMMTRYRQISRAVGKLLMCIRHADKSGQNEKDAYLAALEMYHRRYSKGFEFTAPFQILSKCSKFMLDVNKEVVLEGKRALDEPAEEESSVKNAAPAANSAVKTTPRHGVKAAKLEAKDVRVNERQAASAEKMPAAASKRDELMREQITLNLFAATAVNEEHANALAIQRKLVMYALEARNADHERKLAQLATKKALLTGSVRPKHSILDLCGGNSDTSDGDEDTG